MCQDVDNSLAIHFLFPHPGRSERGLLKLHFTHSQGHMEEMGAQPGQRVTGSFALLVVGGGGLPAGAPAHSLNQGDSLPLDIHDKI